ncbi:MAG: NAD(P)-dependent oxidoreductase [Phycisphaerales bacterium]|nr:MAG: NAD(P)-dependent oxidoreductase [Phycisphaerales bacterium]
MDATERQRVLVTGATGFIGRHLVRRLVDSNYHVAALVRDVTRSRLPADEFDLMHSQPLAGNVTDRKSLDRALDQSQPEVVIHLAGLVRTLQRDGFMRVNADGARNIAAACAAQPSPPVLVVVSSLAAAGPSRADSKQREGDTAAPVSAYGRSKLAGEQAAAEFATSLPITIVRPPIVFGPGDRAVHQMCKPIARWGLHPVFGRGESHLSFVHVDDLVTGLLLAAEKGERVPLADKDDAGRGIYFLAEEEQPTYAEFGRLIAMALGRKPPRVVRVPTPMMKLAGAGAEAMGRMRRRTSWLNRDKITEALAGSWTCTSEKARTHLGWSPAATLSDRLHETVQWYRDAGWL